MIKAGTIDSVNAMIKGRRVILKLYGDEYNLYSGIIDNPKKECVLLSKVDKEKLGFEYADESNIDEWEYE